MKLKSNLSIIFMLLLCFQIVFSVFVLQIEAQEEDDSKFLIVIFETSMGNITIRLRDDMPITVGNFKNLTQQGVYDNTIFHRVIADFMIQGGDPTGSGYGDPSIPTIDDEFSENPENNKNYRGTIAMANTGFPNSGSSQFFINVVYNSHLDNLHPVFGDVIVGMDVVDAISTVDTTANGRPLETITIINPQVIPEFPSWIILPLFLAVTVSVIGFKKKLFNRLEK